MKTTSNKLSPTQIEVLTLMNQGWELGRSEGFFESTWLQKDGLGKGGPTKRISIATLYSLVKKGYILHTKTIYPNNYYVLTTKGKGYTNLLEIVKENN